MSVSKSLSNSSGTPELARPSLNGGGHGLHGHVVQFYKDHSFLLDELSRFIGTAIGGGDSAIVIATEPHRLGLRQRLKASGLNVAEVTLHGRLVMLDAAETLSKFMNGDMPDPHKFATLIGGVISSAKSAGASDDTRISAFGEMVSLLWDAGKIEAAIRLEGLWNGLAQTHSFTLRCAYPIAGFDHHEHGESFLKICGAHSHVIPADDYTSLQSDSDRLRNVASLQQKAEVHQALQQAKLELESQIAKKTEAERKLRESEISLQQLSAQILRTQEDERRHLGRELHDSVGQYLAALKMSLEMLKPEADGSRVEAGEQLNDCLRLVDQSILEVRTMSYLLYPPMLEELGLATAVPWYLEGFAKRSGIQTTFEIPPSFGRLNRVAELAIFRVLQESLTNVHRHSGSAHAHVSLQSDNDAVTVTIKDAGKGIPAALLPAVQGSIGTLGVGLRGMSERMRQLNGKLELYSNESGTKVVATLPRIACELETELAAKPN